MKIWKKLYLFFIIILISHYVSAQQTYFNKIYNPYNTIAISRHIVVLDTVYLIGGLIKDSSTYVNTLAILVIDNNGNLKKVMKPGKIGLPYGSGSSGSFNMLLDNSYIWAGQIRTSVKDIGFLIKLDSSLNKEWEKEFMLNNDTVYSYLGVMQTKQTYDNGYVLVGDVDASGQYNTDILLIKTDSLGNKVWQKTYSYIGVDRGWNIIQTHDKGFLIGAGGYIATLKHSYNGLIIKTDSLGNEQWRKSIGSSSYDDYFCVVENSPDGNYIVGLASGVGIINPDNSYRRIRLLKISPSGSVIWDKMYNKAKGGNALNQIIILDDGSIVATGFMDADSLQIGDSWGWMLKTNTNGDSLWMREHYYFNGHANANRFYDIKQTQDGGFIACGQVDSLPAIHQSIWVLKVDSFGCDSPGCHTVGINTSTPLSVRDIIVFPNPASYEITIDFGEAVQDDGFVEIYNITGVLVSRRTRFASKKYPNKIKIDVSQLKIGLYIGKVIFDNGYIRSFKFVVD